MQTATVQSSANLQAALRYAAAGYPVLLVWPLTGRHCACPRGSKCPTPGKHPIENNWTARATTDADKLRSAFKRWPSAHVGIMPPAGHCIIDIDPRNGGTKTLKTLLAGRKVPTTPVQHSGGGGMHLVFAGEPHGPLGKGIDVKRNGRGYVVAWPAGHISGGQYKWRTAPWDAKPAALPDALQGEVSSSTPAPFEPPVPTAVPLETVRLALAHVSSDEYTTWVNVGQALRHNYGDEGHEIWVEWSRSSSKYRDGDEDKWDTFDRNRDRPLITVRSILSMARRAGYRPLAQEFNQGLWALGDISSLLENDAPALDWVLEPCIPAGKVTLIAGAGGSSKSYLALTLSMQLAIEQAFGPFKAGKPGKALMLVAEENLDDVHRRLHAIRAARMYTKEQCEQIAERVGVVSVRGLDWRLVYHDENQDLQETDRVDYLIDEVRGLGDVRLLVLDPLVAFNGAAENNNMEMARLMFTLDRIAERTGCAVVVLHHVSKGGQLVSLNDATQAMVRGASALVDNARAVLLLTRMPRTDAPLYGLTAEQAGRFVVARVVKNNYGPYTPDVIFAVEAGGALRLAPEVVRTYGTLAQAQRAAGETDTAQRVLRALHENPQSTQHALAQAAGVTRQRVGQLVQGLLEDGMLARTGVGPQTRYNVTPEGRAALGISDGNEPPNDLF